MSMRGSLIVGLGALAALATRADAAITVTFNASPPELLVPQASPMPVSVNVTSTFDVASVVARVGTVSVDLAPQTLPDWGGTMNLTSLPYGNLVVEVTATDVFGATATAMRTFAHDEKPVITVVAPLPNTVARPIVHVTATCTDDDPGGACRLFGAAFTLGGGVAGVNGVIDADIDLAASDGSAGQLWITARDAWNQPVGPRIPILVENSPDLVDVATLGQRMLDVDATRFLYVDADGLVRVRQRAGGAEQALGPIQDRGTRPPYGRLTSTGAVYVSMLPPSAAGDQETFEWRGAGAPVSLGLASSTSIDTPWTIVGDWGWRIEPVTGHARRRNFATGVEADVDVPADVGGPLFTNNRWMLAANGDLVRIVRDGDAVRFVRDRGGVQTEVGRGLLGSQNNPVYDGTAIAYLHPASPNDRVALVRAGDVPLVLGDPLIPQYPGETYQVGGGFVAFTRVSMTSGARQIWRRSPAGVEEKLTPFAADSVIDAVAPDGKVAVVTGGQTRYLAIDGTAPPLRVGSELGRPRFLPDALYVVIGNRVLRFGQGGGVPIDAGVTDAAVGFDAGHDAGTGGTIDAPTGATDAADGDAGTSKPGGGGCAVGGAGGGASVIGLGLELGLGLALRRRRRRAR